MSIPQPSLSTPGHWAVRWLLIRPGVFVAGAFIVLAFPALVVLGAIVDVVFRRWTFGTVRIVVFAAWYILAAVLVQLVGLVIWIRVLGRSAETSRTALLLNRELINFWIRAIRLAMKSTVRMRIEVDNPELVGGGTIIAARHQSLGDVFIPTGLAAEQGVALRVVLAAGLRREPSLELFGSRTPQYFLQRNSSDMESELAAIADLAEGLDDQTALVIFSEGGLFREDRKAKVIAALERRDPAQADRARRLRHLLPAKAAGFSALLDGAPDADVVIVGHVGFEQLTDPVTIWRNVPLNRPIKVAVSRYSRADLPDALEERKSWLNDRWDEMDLWIEDNLHPSEVPEPMIGRDQQ